MSKKSKSSTTSTMNSPQMAMLQDVYNRARAVADKPFQEYGGQTLAGINQDQLGAFDMVRQGVNNNVGGDTLNQAIAGTSRAMAFNPMQVSGVGYNPALMQAANFDRSGVRDVQGGSFLDQNIGAYMNPFTNEVIDRAMADLDRARQMQMNQDAASAIAAGAFGGSRHGVVDSLTNAEFFRNVGNMSAGLRSQAFDNAMGLAGQDLNRGFQAQIANQGMDFNAGSLNAGFQQQANAANQDARNAARAFGASATNAANLANQSAGLAGAQLNLGAAGQLAGLSDQQRQQFFQNAALLEGVGDRRQVQQQAELDDAYARWLERQNYDMNMAGFLGNIVNSMPNMGGTATATSSPSTASQLGSALGTIGGIVGIISDENIKSGRKPVSDEAVLEGFRKTPVERWRYDPAKGGPDDGGAQHIGPMAQSVAKNLGIGDGRSIPVVDMMGSQTAAIRALDRKVRRLEGKKGGK